MATINLSLQELLTVLKKIMGSQGLQLAFDPLGGHYLERLLSALRPQGTLVSIKFTGGKVPSLDLVNVVVNEKKLQGYAIHVQNDRDTARHVAAVIDLTAQGRLRPRINSKFAMEDFERGYARLSSRKAMGSILLNLRNQQG